MVLKTIWHRFQNLFSRTFLVFVMSCIFLIMGKISDDTWLYVAIVFIGLEKIKDSVIGLKK